MLRLLIDNLILRWQERRARKAELVCVLDQVEGLRWE
jgi:hypothetical protein